MTDDDGRPATTHPRSALRQGDRSRPLAWLVSAGIAVLLVAGMQALHAAAGSLVMPHPADVLRESIALWADGTIPRALGETLAVLAPGFLLAAATGIAGGVVLGGVPFLGRVMEPFVNALNATPAAAFVPLVIVWFGLFGTAKVVVVWYAAVFPILIATAAGIANASRELTEMARAFGAGRRALFWQVMVPDALPGILAGLRIGAAVSVVGTVIAELTMAQSGLGGLLVLAGNRFQMDRYFAVVLVLMALGVLLSTLLRQIERRLCRWRVQQAGIG